MPFNCIYTGCKQVIKKKCLNINQFINSFLLTS